MPRKPRPTRKTHRSGGKPGRVVPNLKATALSGASARSDASHDVPRTQLRGALQLGNADIVAWTNEAYLADVERSGSTTRMRYTRVLGATMAHFGCSRATAQRAMRDAELMRAADAEARRPTLQARVLDQLQRIADRQEEAEPHAAIAALREVSRITGLYAPLRATVTHGVEPPLELRAIMAAVVDDDPEAQAALDVLLAKIEAAKADGRLKLPEPSEDVVDAEVVESDAGAN